MTTYSAQSIVFIDSRVPDLQDLLNGVQSGDLVYVLNPDSDGVEQIADILAANNLSGLASISIVAHGAPGEIEIGSTLLSEQNLAKYATRLAEIGAAMAPGGNLLLFGCDVGSGAAGMQFINDLSTLTSGTVVGAATHDVGSAAEGGTWTLDAATGDLTQGAPFTADALGDFQGLLAVTGTVELWIASTQGGTGNGLFHADDTGTGTASNTATIFTPSSANNPTGVQHLSDVALDTQNNAYFLDFSNIINSSTGLNIIVKASLSQALGTPTATPTFTTLYSDTSFAGIGGIAVDDPTQKLYFIEKNRFERVNYDGSGLVTLGTAANVSAHTAFVDGLTLDVPHGTAYFYTNHSTSTFTGPAHSGTHITTILDDNGLYVDSNIATAGSTLTRLPISPDDTSTHNNNFPKSLGMISGIAVDTVNEILYFTTEQTNASGTSGIYKYNLTGNPSGTYSAVWLEPSTATQVLFDISVNPTTGKYYVSDKSNAGHKVLVGNLNSTAAPTAFFTLPTGGAQLQPLGLALDNAPTLAITTVSATFTESTLNPASSNNTPVSLISAATATDPDNTSLVSAIVNVGSFFAGDVLSAVTTGTSITSSYNSSTGVLTLSGVDSFAHYQTVLATVKYTSTSDNPTDYGSDTSRALTWTVNDGLLTAAPQTATVTVVGVNDPPTLSSIASTAQYTENAAGTTLSGAAVVVDPDNLNLANATVSIGGATFAGDGDVLATSTAGTSVTASYNSTTETLVLSGSDTLAHYQTVLDKITFSSTSDNPTNYGSNLTRTVTWLLNDGSGSFNLSTVQTETVTVTAVNDPPTLTSVAGSVSFTEGQAVTLSSAVTVADPDNLNLASATVKVAGGTFAGDGDVLATSTTGTGITASYNSTTETLTLTGTDTLAHYQTVLDKITFSSGSNPDDYGSNKTRTVTWVLNDGSGSFNLSTAQTETISITAINDPPALSNVATTASYTENAGAQATLSSALTVSDVDNLNLANATVNVIGGSFAGDGDVLSVNGVSNGTIALGSNTVTISYNSTTETLTLTGTDTLAHYQTLLEEVGFNEPSIDNPTNYGSNPTRTVTWLVNDGSGSNNLSSFATTTLSITAINDAPTLASVASSVSFTEEGGAVTLSNAVSVTDPDNLTLASATVSITGGTFANDGDVLSATGNGTITASFDSANERLILTGSDTLADYQSVLDTVTFNAAENPTNFGSNATRTVTWVLNDGSGSFATSTARTETISITNVNDAPTLANVASSAQYTEEGAAATLSSVVAVSDPDNLKLVAATVSIVGGTFAGDGDVLAADTTGTSITASYDSTNERLVLTGSDTLANYQTVLDRVTFAAAENPTNFGSNPTRTVTWVLNDGSGSFNTSTAQTTTVTITNVNDAPTLTGTATSVSYTENGASAVLSSNVTVADPDNLKLVSATVAITGGSFAGDGDVLAADTTGTAITASYDSSTETLVLTGTDTLADYRSVLDTVAFNSTSENPTNFGSNLTRIVSWVLNDGSASFSLSTAQTETVSVIAVNDAPTLSSVASSLTVAPSVATTISPSLSVSDPDNLALVSATVSITGGTFVGDGDVLAATDTGSITSSYDTLNERLILTGSDTLANYKQVLDSVTFAVNSADPTNGGADPTRTLTWVVDDGSGSFSLSAAQTTTISVQNGPAINPPAHAAFTENGVSVTLAPSLVVTDSNGGVSIVSATVAITSGSFAGDGDVLAVDATVLAGTGITASYDALNEVLTLTGSDTLANYQSVLDTVSFTTPSDNPTDFASDPTRTVTWTITDSNGSNNTGSATSTIDITAINDPPTLAGTDASVSFVENAGTVVLSSNVTVSDPDNENLTSATVSIAGGTFAGDGDVLAADTSATSITASYDSTNERLILSGSDTLAHYQQVLDTITFDSTSDNPDDYGSDPTRTVAWVLNDGSGSFATSAAQTEIVSITAINDAPTLTNVALTDAYTAGDTITVSPSVTVADPDNLDLASATVSITSGTFTGDTLAATGNGTIVVSYDSSTETLTLTGDDTLADYQQVLDSITFSSTAADPTNAGADPTRTLTWVLSDGSATSTANTTTISIHSGAAIFGTATADFTENGASTTLAPSASVTDTGAATLVSATVALTGGTFANDGDVLAADTSGTSINASYDSTTETLTLLGNDTLAHYQSVLRTVTFDSGSDNPTDFGSDPTRTVTWTVDDGTSTGTSTSTLSITAVNDAPTLTGTASSVSFVENAGTVVLSSNVTVSDPDNLNLASATVSITGGTFAGDGDVLAADTSSTSITASYDSTSERLILSGSDTLAHYRQVLDTITFNSTSENPDDYGSDPTRTVSWVLNDGAGSSNLSAAVIETVSITAVNDAPTLSNVSVSDSFTVGTTITLSSSVSVSDPDNLSLASATVSITGGTFASDGDVLAADTSGTSITASYDSNNERLILTGSDTLADYQAVLDSVTFSSGVNPNNSNSNPTRTVTWVLNDGASTFSLSTAATTTINVAHEPPTLTSVAPSVGFTQGNTTTLSPSVTVTDFDSANLSSATVKVTGGSFAGDGDVLSASVGGTSITASYNAASETLTLTGTDTLAHYQTVLDSVKFSSGSDPTNHGSNSTRTVTWVVNDGNGSLGQSTVQTTTITITPLDAAPTLSSVAASANFTENGAAVTLSGSASVSDPDSTTLTSATVSIAGGVFVGDNDVLAFDTTGTVITASYDSTNERLTLTGADTLAHYRQVLDSVTFNEPLVDNPTDYGSNPTRTITWVVKDDFNIASTLATTTVSITAINDAPTLTSVAGSVSFLDGSTVQLSPTASVSDPDSLNIVNATVKITGGAFVGDGDQLTANVAGTHITASYNAATETLVLTGSDPLATYQAVLDSITFSSGSNPDNSGSNPTRTVTWVVNDGSGSNNLSGVSTETISITAVNDPPALSGVTNASYTEEGAAVTLSGSASVSDPDNATLANATVAIVGGTYAGDGDVLAFSTTGTSINASYDSSTETLTLTGSDTLAHYQQVLDSITFAGRPENPNNYGSNPFRTVTWVLNDGSASNNLSTVQTTTITVNNVNDTPTLTNIPTTASYTEEGTIPITLASTASLSDPDNLTFANATVAITGGTFAGDGNVLTADTTGTSITASYDSTTETLTLTGTDTTANYAQVLESITFTTRLENPNNYGSNPTRTITWTVNDGAASSNLATATTTVSITNVNDAPTLANVAASAAYTENSAAVTLSGSASVSDPDNLKLVGATVKVAGGTFVGDGDQLAVNVGGTSILGVYNLGTETLTLSGTDTLAHYQQVLDSLTFVSTSDNPDDYGSNPTRTVTWVLNDGSGSFNLSTTQTETVSITAINDAPTLTSVVGVTSYTENAAPITVSPSITVSDVDNLKLANATVSISNTFAGDGDVLAANTTGTSITASYNSTTEVLTLSGSDTLAHYQQVLDSVVFSSTSDNPTDYGSFVSRVLTWSVNDGSGSNNTSSPQFTTVVVTAVNDAPTLSNVAAAVIFVPQHTITISPSITVSDPDTMTLANATVKITGGTFAGDGDVLAANVSGTSITASYNAATETLTLTGSDTLAHYQSVLDSVTFSSGSNPSNGNLNRTRTLTWVVNDGSGSNNLSTAATTTISIGGNIRNDFDGDNKSDLLLQNLPFSGTPDVMVELLNGFTIASSATIVTPSGWSVEASGDFNHDNKADILLQNTVSGLPQIWLMNGTTATSTVTLPNPGPAWHPIATGDFDSDGNVDILWQNTDGRPAIWEMNGTSIANSALLPNPGSAWRAIGTGDFNGDGHSDILFQNVDGRPAIWDMNGLSIASSALLVNPGTNWHVIGTGDFDGDGKADILWQADNGQPVIWQMNDTSIVGGGVLPNPGTAWHAIGTSDFNGDGFADIVLQNVDGRPAIWEMNGASIIASALLPNPGATWHVKDDGPISPDQMGSDGSAPQPPVLHHSSPDAANAVPMTSTPDAANPSLHLSAPDPFNLACFGADNVVPNWLSPPTTSPLSPVTPPNSADVDMAHWYVNQVPR